MEKRKNFPTYIFATVNHGRIPKVVEELKRDNHVDLISPITGRFDLALRLKEDNREEVYEELKKIREIPDIRRTASFTPFEGFQPVKKIENQMPIGFTLLHVEHKPFEHAIDKLKEVPGLVEAFTVPGECDIVALWQGRTTEEIVKNSFEKVTDFEEFSSKETLIGRTPFFKP